MCLLQEIFGPFCGGSSIVESYHQGNLAGADFVILWSPAKNIFYSLGHLDSTNGLIFNYLFLVLIPMWMGWLFHAIS